MFIDTHVVSTVVCVIVCLNICIFCVVVCTECLIVLFVFLFRCLYWGGHKTVGCVATEGRIYARAHMQDVRIHMQYVEGLSISYVSCGDVLYVES